MSAFCVKGPMFNPGQGIPLFAGPHLLQLQHLLAGVHGALIISVADAGFIITFYSCGQSTFIQC